MFTLIKITVVLGVLLGATFVIIYFLPSETKLNTLQKINESLSEKIGAKAEAVLLTPSQKRDKIINELEETLKKLKYTSEVEEGSLIEKSEMLIETLKEKNEAANFSEIITTKLAEKILGLKEKDTAGENCRLTN